MSFFSTSLDFLCFDSLQGNWPALTNYQSCCLFIFVRYGFSLTGIYSCAIHVVKYALSNIFLSIYRAQVMQ